jgi:hypothetical protein
MDVLDYVTPEKIFDEYAKIYVATGEIEKGIRLLADAELDLDREKAAVQLAPGFVAEKNQALQDLKWLGMFPEKYAKIKSFKEINAGQRLLIDQARVTLESYNMTLRLFELIANLKTA